MAYHAIGDVVAKIAVDLKVGVAVVAVRHRHDGASRRHGGPIHGEVGHLVGGAIRDRLRQDGARVQRGSEARLDADHECAGGARRNDMGEGVRAGAIGAAGRPGGGLGDIARRGGVRAEVGHLHTGHRTGHGERQSSRRRSKGAHGNAVALVVPHREGDGGSLSGGAVGNLDKSDVNAGDLRRLIGNHVRALDGGVEFQFALRDVARGALRIVDLRQVHMVGAGGKIDVIVACPAGCPVGIRQPCVGLGRSVIGIVAGLAAAHIGGIDYGRKVAHRVIVSHNLIRLSRHHGRQGTAHVEGVDEDLHIQAVSGARVDSLRLMADDAQPHAAPGPSVGGQTVGPRDRGGASMAGVAILRSDHIARVRFGAVGHPIEGGIGVVGAEVPHGQVPRTIYAYPVGGGRIVVGGQLGTELIDVFAGGHRSGGAAGVAGRLGARCGAGDGRHRTRDVGSKLRLAGGNIGDQKAERNGAGGDDPGQVQRRPVGIRQLVVHRQRTVGCDLRRNHRDGESGLDVLHQCRIGVERLVVGREFSFGRSAYQHTGAHDQYHCSQVPAYREDGRRNPHMHLQFKKPNLRKTQKRPETTRTCECTMPKLPSK